MQTTNLVLWSSVEKTPVEQTKPITGKSYNGNSPKPHHIVRRATETFGPCGIGWGFDIVEERIVEGAVYDDGSPERLHTARVRVWYMWGGQRGEVEHVGGTILSGRRKNGAPFTDDDAPKKSVTDALVKALSMVGFAGDIFLGRYDDSKYMAELRQEAADAKKPPQSPPQPRQPQNTRAKPFTAADTAQHLQAPPNGHGGDTPFDDGEAEPVVEYVTAGGQKKRLPVSKAVSALEAAYDATDKLDNDAFNELLNANAPWARKHAPAVWKALSTAPRGQE